MGNIVYVVDRNTSSSVMLTVKEFNKLQNQNNATTSEASNEAAAATTYKKQKSEV